MNEKVKTILNAGDPIAFVIFGVTGDLAHRKLMPALYELCLSGRLVMPLMIIGFARRDWSNSKLKDELNGAVQEFARSQPTNSEILGELISDAAYVQSSFDEPQGYSELKQLLEQSKISNAVFYLATPPEAYSTIIQQLGEHGLNKSNEGWRRIVIEKPYGTDLQSAKELEKEVHQVFSEEQVYRIDHYLGKETVQNILVFRFANGIFEPLWNRHHIDHVEITVAESVGVGSRAGYYDTAGVIRDIFQNHLLQLLTLTAMEAPVRFNAESVRDEKVKVLHALRPLRGQEAINNTYRAQYVSGLENASRVPGYKDEKGVPAETITETYMAAKIFIDNWRWAGVPFYLRSGKRLPSQVTGIVIQFSQVPLSLFGWRNLAGSAPNMLILNLQPDEGITLTFGAKAPGPINTIEPVRMNFSYTETFGKEPPDAYERLILDVLHGDPTLFTRSDEVLAAWSFTTDILKAWSKQKITNLPVYEAGTWGPPGADEFINREGRMWKNLLT